MSAGRQRLLLAVCAAPFLNLVNLSSVNLALPDIAAELAFSEAALQWVVSSYALAFAGVVLLGGRLADLYGGRRVMSAGFALFGVSALVAAVAPSAWLLVVARGLQGVGAALMVPAGLEVIGRTFRGDRERARAVASFGVGGAVGFAAGLVIGGLVTELLGWRWLLGLNAPVALALAVLVLAWVPGREATPGTLDLPGALVSTAGLVALVYGLTGAAERGLGAPGTVAALAAAVVLLAAFLVVQARTARPLMPLRVWRAPGFAPVIAATACLYAGWVGANYFLALTLQQVLGYSAVAAALALLPIAVGGFVVSTLAGRLLPRTGARPLLIVGFTLYGLGLAVLAGIGPEWSYLAIGPLLVLIITGQALAYVSANVAAIATAADGEQGLAGGLFNVALQVGGGVGLAVLASVSAAVNDGGVDRLGGYQAAFWAATAITALGLAVVVAFVRSHPRAGVDPAATPTR